MLNEADEFCRRALKLWTGRVKEDDASYRWTMELAIKICKARGENELAEAYEAQLPATKPTSKTPREQLLSVFQSARKR
jgi:Tfp pilus assembly protein PilF